MIKSDFCRKIFFATLKVAHGGKAGRRAQIYKSSDLSRMIVRWKIYSTLKPNLGYSKGSIETILLRISTPPLFMLFVSTKDRFFQIRIGEKDRFIHSIRNIFCLKL